MTKINTPDTSRDLTEFSLSVFRTETFAEESSIRRAEVMSYGDDAAIIIAKTLAFKLGIKHGPGLAEAASWVDLANDCLKVRVNLTVFLHKQ
jgi:hypothetical protein